MSKDKLYQFQPQPGEAGIPGLPHTVSEQEAEQLGVAELLKAAIEAGRYKEVKPEKAKEA